MGFMALQNPDPDIFTTAFSLRKAVYDAVIRSDRNPESARALPQAADRLLRIILGRDAESRLFLMYQMNLALRALVYDLYDEGAISDVHTDAILSQSFRFERRHLAGIAHQEGWSDSAGQVR